MPDESTEIYGQFFPVAKAAEIFAERWTPSGCIHDPGFDVDLFVNTDTIPIHKVRMGMASFADCIDEGLIELDGLTAHVDAFPSWFKLSDFAGIKPAVVIA